MIERKNDQTNERMTERANERMNASMNERSGKLAIFVIRSFAIRSFGHSSGHSLVWGTHHGESTTGTPNERMNDRTKE